MTVVSYLDIGSKLLDSDGNLPGAIVSDYLQPGARGYEIAAIKSTGVTSGFSLSAEIIFGVLP
jgi:hypothetical protein